MTANRIRVGFTLDLTNSGFDFGKIIGSGGRRQLSSSERSLALDAGAIPAAQLDEYEHLAWVIHHFISAQKRQILRSEGEPTRFDSWRTEVLKRGGQAVAYLVQAPSRRAGRRADTLDAVLFARRHLGMGAADTLVVTSSIYARIRSFCSARTPAPWHRLKWLVPPLPTAINLTGRHNDSLKRFMRLCQSSLSSRGTARSLLRTVSAAPSQLSPRSAQDF